MQPFFFYFIGFFMVVNLGIRLFAWSQDRYRIRDYLDGQGATLLTCKWSPFARGWLGSTERLYAITYNDLQGNLHNAVCKTNWLAGVYFTEDINENPPPRKSVTEQEYAEVVRLRNEVADLKRKLGK